jgi:hypothetical protein
MSINKCPPGNLQSFPVRAGFDVTNKAFTNAKKKPLNIKFNWGTRTTAPNFSYASSGLIDHTQNDSLTTLMYNGVLYTLVSVQLTAPSHNTWLTPESLETTKIDNVEDIMITFQRDMYAPPTEEDPYVIILVNPILRNRSQNGNPLYLTNMANQVASGVTLESIFPYVSMETYAYYTTCVNGLTAQDPYKNILVLLNVKGMSVSAELMIKIRDMYNKFSEGDYPTYVPPGNFNTYSNPKDYISNVREGFASSQAYLGGNEPNEAGSSPIGPYKVDKCVPIDIDTQVGSDGVITFDTSGGVTTVTDLSGIKIARDKIKAEWIGSHTGKFKFTSIERYFIYAVVGILILGIVTGVLNFLFGWTNPVPVAPSSAISGSAAETSSSIWMTSIFALATFIGGFFVGMYTLPPDGGNAPSNVSKEIEKDITETKEKVYTGIKESFWGWGLIIIPLIVIIVVLLLIILYMYRNQSS